MKAVRAECPRCGALAVGKADVEATFGFRNNAGYVMPQAWCRRCRGGGDLAFLDQRPKPKGDRWATPQQAFDALHAEFGFTVDAAAEAKNAKLPTFFRDGLASDWAGKRVFCNPPYSDLYPWLQKAAERVAEIAVLVLPVRTGTTWWHDFVWDHDAKPMPGPRPGVELRWVRGRMKFEGADGSPAWDTVVAIFHPGGA